MRKTRLVLIPGVKSLDTIGCLLLFLACPTIAFKGQENREVDTICKEQNLKEFWVDSPWPGDTENIGWARGFGGGNWPGKSQQNTCNDRTRSVVRSGRSDERRVQVRREIARDDGFEIRRIRLDNEAIRETRMRVDVGRMRDSRRLSDEERRQNSRRVRDHRRESTSLDREMRFPSAESRTVTKREIIDARWSSRAFARQDGREIRMKKEVRGTENRRALEKSDPTSVGRRIVSNRETIDLMRRDSRLSIRSENTKAWNIESRRTLGTYEREELRSSDERRSIEQISMGSRRLSGGTNGRLSSRSLERELASRRVQRKPSERERSAERYFMHTREDARTESTSSIRSLNRRSDASESRHTYNRERADSRFSYERMELPERRSVDVLPIHSSRRESRSQREVIANGSQFRSSRRTSESQREMNDGKVSTAVDREERAKRGVTERRELSRSSDIRSLRENRIESRRDTENRRNNRFFTQSLNRQIRSDMEVRELQTRKISRERDSRSSDDSTFERRITSSGLRNNFEDFRQPVAYEREARMIRDSRESTSARLQRGAIDSRESRRTNSMHGDRRVDERSQRASRLTRSLERVRSTDDNREVRRQENNPGRFSRRSFDNERINLRSVRDDIRYPAPIQRSTRSAEGMRRADRADIRTETERSKDRREMERGSRNDKSHHDHFMRGRDERRIHAHERFQRVQARSSEDVSWSDQRIRLTRAGRELTHQDTRRTVEEREINRVGESTPERISRRIANLQRVDIRRKEVDTRSSVLSRKAHDGIISADIRTRDKYAVRRGDQVMDDMKNDIEREAVRNSIRIAPQRPSRRSADAERANIRRVRDDAGVENRRNSDETLSRNLARITPERQIQNSVRTGDAIRILSGRLVRDVERAGIRRVRHVTRSQTRLLREARSLEEVSRSDRRMPSVFSRHESTRFLNRQNEDGNLSRNLVRINPEGIREDFRALPQHRNIRNADERRATDREARRINKREALGENNEIQRVPADIRRMHRDTESRRILQDVSLKIDSIRTYTKETRRSDRQRHAVHIDRAIGRFADKRLDSSLSTESFRRLPDSKEPTMKPQRSIIRELDGELLDSAKKYAYFHESPKNAFASWLTADIRTDLNGIAETLMYGGIACFALFSNVNKKVIF